jgi:hypothetical protein
MVALDDLRVAAGASQFFTSPEISEVGFVIERNSSEPDFAREKSRIMTAALET